MSRIRFLGAAGTVTGSKYIVEIDEPEVKANILVDAGLFQGDKYWREQNWHDFKDVRLDKITACLITHAHIDHTGFLPRLVKLGLNCPVYSTPATCRLAELLLLDSARLQEDEAKYRSDRGKSSHEPPLPLYRVDDAKKALTLLRALSPAKKHQIVKGISVEFNPMGHILGASSINLAFADKMISFSGDIGRYDVPILKDPAPIDLGNLLLIESTYARTEKHAGDSLQHLAENINSASQRGGALIIPSFAIGRTQSLLYHIRELKEQGLIQNLPVYVDSPMATDATEIYASFPDEYDEEALGLVKSKNKPFSFDKLKFINSAEESKALNQKKGSMIIISASGMATGGRVLHHLKNRLPHKENSVLFVGYQPAGSRGEQLIQGRDWVSIFNERVSVKADIKSIGGLSAHADQSELLRWLKSCRGEPEKVAVVHGEPESASFFAGLLKDKLSLNAAAPQFLEQWEI